MVSSEVKQRLPLLIIDKKGNLGTALAEKFKEQFLIVLVSGRELEVHENIIHIPYRKKIPMIPDNSYSHMFVIYNGEKEMLDMLSSFVKKANETNSKLFFITALTHSTKELFSRLSHQIYHSMQIIAYGEIFDEKLSEVNELTFFIHQARTTGRIEIPNDGLGRIFPVLLEDVLIAIISIAFAFEKKKRILFVFHRSGFTELSVIRSLRNLSPQLKLDFKKYKNYINDYFIPEDGESIYQEYDLDAKLRKIDVTRRNHYIPSSKKKIRIPGREKQHSRVWPIIAGIICLLLLPIMLVFFTAIGGSWAMKASLKQTENGKFADAKNSATLAGYSFSAAKNVTEFFGVVDAVAPAQRESFLQQLQVGNEAAQTEIDILNAAIVLQKIVNAQSSDPKNDFYHALATIKNSLIVLQKMKAENQLPASITTKLSEMDDSLTYFENTIDTLPALLGFEGKRKYLVLFQNNMELRPGGGFIGSYGILELDNGKLNDFKIADVYDADGKLNTHVEPPYAIRRYLGVQHWFLRDSNMDIDFTRDGAEAAKFLGLEVGEKVDGVIAIDTDFLKNMLSAFGSVRVEDYKETVRPDNFYMLTQTYAEKDFFPGSTQKKDFLRALANAMLLQLSEKKSVPWGSFVKEIGESIKQKHLLFAFSDPAIQELFTVNKLSSSLWDGRKASDNTFLDSFGVVDANLGVNKVNYYLKRTIQQDAVIDEAGNLQTTATITYENTSAKSSPFGGDYKNYVHFLLPANASLQTVKVDDQDLPTIAAITDPAVYTKKGFIPPSELEVEQTQEAGKSLVGFFFIVPAGTTRKIAITYSVDAIINTDNPAFSYSLSVFKQPGTENDPYSCFLTYPAAFTFIKGDPGISDVGGKLNYSTNLSEDKTLEADFSKK